MTHAGDSTGWSGDDLVLVCKLDTTRLEPNVPA